MILLSPIRLFKKITKLKNQNSGKIELNVDV